MKRLFFIPALCLLFASCGGDKGTDDGGVPSLKVEPSSLDFAAVSAPSQNVTVTAENVEWEVRVSETASSWLKAEKTDGTTVTVSVTDNGTPEQRTGSFTVAPTNGEDVKAKSVTVTQSGGDVEYKFSVEPAALTFEAEGAAAQTVTITAEGGLTWEAKVEGDAASWITVTPGEGTLEVKVSDNPEATERSGNVVITPSAESIGAKAIRVTQAGKVLPPSLSIDMEDPETGVRFRANGAAYNGVEDTSIRVTAVNTDWNARAVDAEGNAITWLKTTVNKNDGLSSINVDVAKNETYEERVGYVLITATVEGVPEIRVTVTQDAAREHFSTLTDDVDVGGFCHAYGLVTPNQTWEEPDMAAAWTVRFWTDGVEHDPVKYTYTGTGARMEIAFTTEHMGFNDDQEYYLSEGVYTVAAATEDNRLPPMHVNAGYPGYFDYQHFGSWYIELENGEETVVAPIAEGTVTVASAGGDCYTFTFDCMDDAGFAITGSYTVELSYKQNGMPVGPPPVTASDSSSFK